MPNYMKMKNEDVHDDGVEEERKGGWDVKEEANFSLSLETE